MFKCLYHYISKKHIKKKLYTYTLKKNNNMIIEEALKNPKLSLLLGTISSLPGIIIINCDYSKNDYFKVCFKSSDRRGLFLLSKAISSRYFCHFNNWNIIVTAGDEFINNYLPIYFCLSSLERDIYFDNQLLLLNDAIFKLLSDSSVLEAYGLGNLVRK